MGERVRNREVEAWNAAIVVEAEEVDKIAAMTAYP